MRLMSLGNGFRQVNVEHFFVSSLESTINKNHDYLGWVTGAKRGIYIFHVLVGTILK